MANKKTAVATAASLRAKSDSAIGAFKTLITSLKATNDEIAAAKAANDAEIAARQEENAALEVLNEQNSKIVQNIEGLLSV